MLVSRYEIIGINVDDDYYAVREHLYVGAIIESTQEYVDGERVSSTYTRIVEAPEEYLLGMQFLSNVTFKKIDVTTSRESLLKEVARVSKLVQDHIDEINKKWKEVKIPDGLKNTRYELDKKRAVKGIELYKKMLDIHNMSFNRLEEYLNIMYDYLNLGGLNTKIKAGKPYEVSNTEIELQLGIPQSILQNWKNKTKNSWEFKLYNMLKHGSWGV